MTTDNLVLLILACHGGELHMDELKSIYRESVAEHGSVEAAVGHFKNLYQELGRPIPKHMKH